MRKGSDAKSRLVVILFTVVVSFVSILCLTPFLLLIIGSFTDESVVFTEGFRLIPSKVSLASYSAVFTNPAQISRAYAVSIAVTLVGTLVSLVLMSMAGYVLSQRSFRQANAVAFYIYFTAIFSGGLVPWYMLIVKYLNLKNSMLSLVLPYLIIPFYTLILRTFIKTVPVSIIESAKMDGANDFVVYLRLIMPLSKPGLASIGLFMALLYWNDWFLTSLFVTNEKMFTLQFFLYSLMMRAEFYSYAFARESSVVISMPTETLKLATAVIVTGPIIFLYPFIQRYLVQGLTIGAVKG